MKRFNVDNTVMVGTITRWATGDMNSIGNDIVTYIKRKNDEIVEISFASTPGTIFTRRNKLNVFYDGGESFYTNDNEMGLRWAVHALANDLIDKNDPDVRFFHTIW